MSETTLTPTVARHTKSDTFLDARIDEAVSIDGLREIYEQVYGRISKDEPGTQGCGWNQTGTTLYVLGSTLYFECDPQKIADVAKRIDFLWRSFSNVRTSFYFTPVFRHGLVSTASVNIRTHILRLFERSARESKQATTDALRRLESLPPGWDGYAAPAIDREISKSVACFIDGLPAATPQPRIVPTMSGGVQLEWYHGNKSLELEFETPARIHYLRWNPTESVEDEDVIQSDDLVGATRLLRWFFGKDV